MPARRRPPDRPAASPSALPSSALPSSAFPAKAPLSSAAAPTLSPAGEPPPHQLSLFDLPSIHAAPAPEASPSGGPGPSAVSPPPVAPRPRHPRGGQASPGDSPAPAPPVSESAAAHRLPPWRHPRAEREITLRDARIAYAVRRARRSSIGFTVSTDGLVVAAPRWVPLSDIEAGLRAKGDWIVRKLQEQAQRRHRLAAARVDWGDGATLPFLGQPLVLVIDPRVTGVVLDAAASETSPQAVIGGVPHTCLRVGLAHDAQPEQVRDAVQGWLQRQAVRLFTERTEHFARALGVRVKAVRLSSAQTRWGSASADGTIRLNWRLVHFALPTIDYVVAHECAHLRHMDHSPRFWDVVRSVVPDLEAARGVLRDEILPLLD